MAEANQPSLLPTNTAVLANVPIGDRVAKLQALCMRRGRPQNFHPTPTFTTTANCIFVPAGVIPQLPTELIRHIIGLADPDSLHTLCFVNSVFKDVAVSHLYEHPKISKPAALIKCLQTVSGSPDLAIHTCTFIYGRFLGGTPHEHNIEYMTYFTSAFGTLLQTAMRNLSHLISLTMQLVGPLGKYLRGAPFRLIHLDTIAEWDADFVAFLEEQSSVHSFIHRGKYRPEVPVSSSTLPNLSFVDSSPPLVSVLLAGRPVENIRLTCFSSTVADESVFQDLGRLGGLSTGPISIVSVVNAVHDASPVDLFRLLAPVAENLPYVTFVHYDACIQGLDEHSRREFFQFLGGFRRLSRLRILSSAPSDLVHSRGGHRRLLESIIGHCPTTLWHVTFNGEIYARHFSGRWMTIEDLMEALEVENKEKEIAESARPEATQCDPDELNAGPQK